ncbi:putative bifunctional diguanylate cyclase/phosphodiesterase [Vibrio algarum]|uniref:GGDEF domain-containing phosphodiesterase n=1 Tax=Vibrio algarum TaxID=3020714 RepID=A0ABT4YWA9_9VIBR|nr:GGDEF domain-containing phosphodiesterase [Vibrio sp. KJ40-1]MDB1125877.1 GGDEF domain-containing phosphodiesterase [Vibrio sp. KJ40-1]
MQEQLRKQIIRDSIISLAVLVLATIWFTKYETFESIMLFLQQHESWELDELFLVLLLSPAILLWFAMRRFRDALTQNRQRVLAEQEFQNKLKFDSLTGLPNNAFLESLLDEKIEAINNSNNTLVFVIISIVKYEALYECHSSQEIDDSLIKLRNRISDISDLDWIIAKPSRNRFALVIEIPEEKNIEVLAHKLSEQLKFIPLNTSEPVIQCKLGLTYFNDNDEPISSVNMMMQAYEALPKIQHDDTAYTIFQKAEEANKLNDCKLRKELSSAISNNELVLHFQPQVVLNSGEILSAEALVRWNHPEKGFLTPDKFIHLIDHHPISSFFGEWVIEAALNQIKKDARVAISVNITVCHIERAEFSQSLAKLLSRYPMVSPSKLKIELTESAGITDYKKVALSMKACTALGIRFSLDDFGTGYSALNQLRVLPIAQIKIDRSFIRNFLTDQTDFMMVSSLIGLASNFNLEVVAEGVETLEQLAKLNDLGCHKVQGFLFSKPLSAPEFVSWINEYNELNFLPKKQVIRQ